MKITLSLKIFVTFFLTYILSVILMISMIHFYTSRKFVTYINKMNLESLDELALTLADEYRKYGGWSEFKKNPSAWRHIVETALPMRPHRNPPFQKSMEPEPRPDSPDALPEWGPPGSHPPDAAGPLPQKHAFRDDPDHFFQQMALFDANGERVAGTPGSPETNLYRDITVDNMIVGRIGLRKIDRPAGPPGMNFLDQQLKIFCFIGVGALLLCAVVSFLLSRHLLSPIRQLVQGTHDLAGLQFDTRINVSSSDELGQLAGDFNRMAQTLERYEQMRRQWISDISHELRTPLSIIRGEIKAMRDGVREFNQTALDSLHTEVLTLTRTVGDLHELSLADSGALHFDWQLVNPALVFQDTLNHYRERFDRRRITIRDFLDIGPGLLVSGDERRLRQLFSNILENSIRYTDSRGTLTIRQACSGKELSIFIEDSGPGVPPQALARIFDRLYRVDFARSRSGEGSGLGLSICKMIAEAHQGSIRAETGEAGGLKLIVSFPLFQAA